MKSEFVDVLELVFGKQKKFLHTDLLPSISIREIPNPAHFNASSKVNNYKYDAIQYV